MAVFCDYCGHRMWSSESHKEHEEECSRNPKNEVASLRARLRRVEEVVEKLEKAGYGDWITATMLREALK